MEAERHWLARAIAVTGAEGCKVHVKKGVRALSTLGILRVGNILTSYTKLGILANLEKMIKTLCEEMT